MVLAGRGHSPDRKLKPAFSLARMSAPAASRTCRASVPAFAYGSQLKVDTLLQAALMRARVAGRCGALSVDRGDRRGDIKTREGGKSFSRSTQRCRSKCGRSLGGRAH